MRKEVDAKADHHYQIWREMENQSNMRNSDGTRKEVVKMEQLKEQGILVPETTRGWGVGIGLNDVSTWG